MKKFLSSLLILTFLLVPVSSIIACTSTTPATSTIKLVWPANIAAQYTYYLSINSGTIKIIQEKISWINKSTKYSLPIIKINGVPLGVENIYQGTQIPEPQTVPTVPETPTTVPVPVPEPAPAPSPEPEPSTTQTSMQSEMLGYINAERANANLAPLILDDKLCQGALLKSKDMAVNKYFSHTSPTYGSPFDMMKSLGITYSLAGENIAKNSSVKGAHDAFMNSSGHRANILNAGFKKVGLGFYQDGYYLYVTQWFTN